MCAGIKGTSVNKLSLRCCFSLREDVSIQMSKQYYDSRAKSVCLRNSYLNKRFLYFNGLFVKLYIAMNNGRNVLGTWQLK